MGYNMKRGNSAVPFKELGSSPAKTHKPGHPSTDMSTLRSKQRRSSKGISEHQYFSDPKSQGDEPRVEGTWGGKKAVKSTTTAHGDLRNAEEEYKQDVELLKNKKR